MTAIEHGAGISILPNYMLEKSIHNHTVKIIYPEFRVTNELYLAYHIKFRNYPTTIMIIDALKENLQNNIDTI